MSTTNTFGGIVTPKDVEQAVADTLAARFFTYLKEMERMHGHPINYWPDIATFTARSTFGRLPTDVLPGAIVVSPGTVANPRRNGGGTYSADFHVGVAMVVEASTEAVARENAAAYSAAATLTLLQYPSLGGIASGLQWAGWQNDFEPAAANQTLGISCTKFIVSVNDVMNAAGMPSPDGSLPAANNFTDPGTYLTVDDGKANVQITKSN
ncbi:MAG: hypothetical protein JHC87_01825 [Thermoleophilaceae bacterium]|nr:hypothetical protein [Thermoleophilaceae bacterium]